MSDEELDKTTGDEEFVAPETGGVENQNKPRSEFQVSTDEMLEDAEKNGERILEIPINISYTVKVPESAFVSVAGHGARLDNAIFWQTHDVKARIDKMVGDSIKEQDPELVEAEGTKYKDMQELRNMTNYSNGFERTSTYDAERAKELVKQVREINEKYKCTDDDLEWIVKGFAELGDSVE